jgi:hypothetical protein
MNKYLVLIYESPLITNPKGELIPTDGGALDKDD